MTDKNKGFKYDSYVHGNPGTIDGRAVGKTAYYSASDNGARLFFPSNHWRNFSRPFTEKMYEGTKNTNPGFLNTANHEDFSTASFYRVKVAFEHGIRVERGKLEKGSDDTNKLK